MNRVYLRFLALFSLRYFLAFGVLAGAIHVLYFHSAFFGYGYDWDPGDGDVLNVIMRVARGMPIYGSWERGEILSLYPPLYHFLFVIPAKLGLDPLTLGRTFNVVAVLGCLYLTYDVTRLLLAGKRHGELVAVLSAWIFFIAWPQFAYANHLRPDAMTWLIVLLGIRIVAFSTFSVRAAAIFSVLGFLAKQNGLVLLAASGLYVLILERNHLKRFVSETLLLLVPCVLVLEAMNGGYFLRSLFWDPNQYFGGSGRLSWVMFKNLWLGFYRNNWLWHLPLAVLGLIAGYRWRSRPVLFVFLVYLADMAYNLKAARHYGATGNYFWQSWSLTAILAAFGFYFLVHALSRGLRGRLNARTVFALASALLAWVCWSTHYRHLFEQLPISMAEAKDASQQHNEHIGRLVAGNPPGAWIAERAPTALIRAGLVVDHELCSVNGALGGEPPPPGAIYLARAMREGRYPYFQTGPGYGCGGIPLVGRALEACYDQIAISHTIFYGTPSRIGIYKYSPKKLTCVK